jgi:hypothetical protein
LEERKKKMYICKYIKYDNNKGYSCPYKEQNDYLKIKAIDKNDFRNYIIDHVFCPSDVKRDEYGSAICYVIEGQRVH